jgi:TRAP-type C4-dicarboxylate transport system permease large subunit
MFKLFPREKTGGICLAFAHFCAPCISQLQGLIGKVKFMISFFFGSTQGGGTPRTKAIQQIAFKTLTMTMYHWKLSGAGGLS